MMKTKGSQRWLITQKSHRGCKLVTPLIFPNDAPVRCDTPVGNLYPTSTVAEIMESQSAQTIL